MQESATEREYLRQRMTIICCQLEQAEALIAAAHARVVPADPAGHESELRQRLRRELRILRNLEVRAPEGHVLAAAEGWRFKLGTLLYDHRQKYLLEQDAYDAWAQLPARARERMAEPPKPPELLITDRAGERWVIDDRFLLALDDIVTKLKKWHASAA